MGMADHSYVINLILLKICNNLKVYADKEGLVRKSLQVFTGLCSGFSTGKFLLKLDATKFMLANHTAETFPSLNDPEMSRQRTSYYLALGRLVVLSANYWASL